MKKPSIKDLLEAKPKALINIFNKLPRNEKSFALLQLPKQKKNKIYSKLSDRKIFEILRFLDSDDITKILRAFPDKRKSKILKMLNADMKNKVEYLLKFNPATAAGLMNIDYIEVDDNLRFREVLNAAKKHEKMTGKFPTIFVIKDGFLKGELKIHLLASRPLKEKIAKHVVKVPHIKYNAESKEVIKKFQLHPHNKLVVLNDDDSIMGAIYSTDVLDLLEKNSAEKLYKSAGVSKEEDVNDSAFTKVKYRYKWLILNLVTAFLAASVVGLFENTIATFTLLAIYMPIIAGMGGNAGTQTMAVMIRGISLKEIELRTATKTILNEVIAGAVNGTINGSIVAVFALLLNKNPLLGLIIAVSMIINLMIAGFFGGIIPLIMKKLGKDPASSATIFITTATDVIGFFVFLGLASLLL